LFVWQQKGRLACEKPPVILKGSLLGVTLKRKADSTKTEKLVTNCTYG